MKTSEPSVANPRGVLLVTSLVSSLVMLDSNVVAVALPTIAHSLKADFADVQWVITAYVLPFAAFLLAAGSFGDIAGRKRASLIGQVVFGLASLACGLATTPLLLNLSRAIQGLGASLLLTASLAIINHSFAGAARAKAYAFWGACLGIAITCGPIVGGVIASTVGWEWAFLINPPICAVLVLATLKVVPESRDPDAKRFDYAGVVTFSGGLLLLTWAVIDGNALGWGSRSIIERAVAGVALMAAFVWIENRQARPMVDFSLFRSQRFLGSAAAMVGYAAGAQVMIFYLPLFLQDSYAFTPIVAGMAMLPFALPMFVMPKVAGRMAWPSRSILCLGLGVSAVSSIAMAMLASQGVSYLPFAVAMALAGTGAGLLNGETTRALQEAVPAQRSGMASGIGATTRFSALLLGVAALGATLITFAGSAYVAAAGQWGQDAPIALGLMKRFAAGDAVGALQAVDPGLRDAVSAALHQAFSHGFSAAAWAASAVTAAALLLVRSLMPNPLPADRVHGQTLPVVPSE